MKGRTDTHATTVALLRQSSRANNNNIVAAVADAALRTGVIHLSSFCCSSSTSLPHYYECLGFKFRTLAESATYFYIAPLTLVLICYILQPCLNRLSTGAKIELRDSCVYDVCQVGDNMTCYHAESLASLCLSDFGMSFDGWERTFGCGKIGAVIPRIIHMVYYDSNYYYYYASHLMHFHYIT